MSARTPGDPAPLSGPRGGASEQRLVQALDTAMRLARLHRLDNELTVEALRNLGQELGPYLRDHSRLSLATSDGWLLLNERVMGVDDDTEHLVDDFIHLLLRNGLGGLLFTGRWEAPELHMFLTAFADASLGNAEQRRDKFERALDLPADAGLEVYAPAEGQATLRAASAMRSLAESGSRDQELQLDDAELASYAACQLRALAEGALRAAREERSLEVFTQALRLSLMKAVDALASQAYARRLQALTLLEPDPEEPFAAHLANVTVHALCMGRLLGLHRQRLLELGYAAFCHDLGRGITGRQPATSKVGELRHTAEPHVLHGVRLALDARAVDGADLMRALVSQEHHRVEADGAYPESSGLGDPHLYSQIVAVADAFDRLETGTPWAAPLNSAAALAKLDESHPAPVVELLRDALGRYPRGTLARTPDGTLMVVVDGGARRGHRPVVRPLSADGRGGKLSELHEDVPLELVSPQHVSPSWRLQALP